MRLEYDLNVGALYIRLTDQRVARTREAGDNANVDLDADGRVAGIEVISITERWPLAQILDGYDIDAAERRQIEAYFRPAARAAALQHDVPVLVAEPTAPVTVAA